MPTIPIYTRGEHYTAPRVSKNAPAPVRLKESYQNTLQSAGELGQAAVRLLPAKQEEKMENSGEIKTRQALLAASFNGVQALDKAAGQVQGANSPAAADWVMLRASALFGENRAKCRQIDETLAQEKNIVAEVASSALSANALALYLNEQLPGYESRLIAAGISAKNAKQESGQVRRLAAQGCIKRAVSAQNYQMAQSVYQKFSGCFSLAEKENLTGLIGAAQAGGKAQIYWDKSLAETDGSAEARLKWAQAQTADKAVLEHLSALGAQAKREEFSKQAREYARLASALSAEDARQRLALSSLDAVGVTARAVSRFGAPASHTSAETFNRLYFGGTEKDNQRAFEKGEISAQEFLVLSAARSFRQAGEEDKTGIFLCAGIDAWAQKKGLSSAAQNEIKRAVLCSSADPQERLNALKQIKTYLDL
ncbi:hypothetical protein [Candidatus Avelusimicrobium fimicolum]|uniref:hypothetical protein n=1 Tax=Candidatus Avelusimicrobium fimicolum TaxID=3416216 RepID=UPI003D0D8E21